jgi:hypothetical protein
MARDVKHAWCPREPLGRLSADERELVICSRRLDRVEIRALLAHIKRSVLARRITERVSGGAIEVMDDKKVERAYGAAPRYRVRGHWRTKRFSLLLCTGLAACAAEAIS